MNISLNAPSEPPKTPDAYFPSGTEDEQSNLSEITAVVVEDDFLSLLEAESVAIDAGLNVVGTAANAEEALRVIEKLHPDLVLMDINLGSSKDGIDVAIEVYNRFGIRCLFTTAYSGNALKARAAVSNPLGWVNKPFTSDTLLREIERATVQLKNRN